jgi:hypothetical protein
MESKAIEGRCSGLGDEQRPGSEQRARHHIGLSLQREVKPVAFAQPA